MRGITVTGAPTPASAAYDEASARAVFLENLREGRLKQNDAIKIFSRFALSSTLAHDKKFVLDCVEWFIKRKQYANAAVAFSRLFELYEKELIKGDAQEFKKDGIPGLHLKEVEGLTKDEERDFKAFKTTRERLLCQFYQKRFISNFERNFFKPGKKEGYIEEVAISHFKDLRVSEERSYEDKRFFVDSAKKLIERKFYVAAGVAFEKLVERYGDSTFFIDVVNEIRESCILQPRLTGMELPAYGELTKRVGDLLSSLRDLEPGAAAGAGSSMGAPVAAVPPAPPFMRRDMATRTGVGYGTSASASKAPMPASVAFEPGAAAGAGSGMRVPVAVVLPSAPPATASMLDSAGFGIKEEGYETKKGIFDRSFEAFENKDNLVYVGCDLDPDKIMHKFFEFTGSDKKLLIIPLISHHSCSAIFVEKEIVGASLKFKVSYSNPSSVDQSKVASNEIPYGILQFFKERIQTDENKVVVISAEGSAINTQASVDSIFRTASTLIAGRTHSGEAPTLTPTPTSATATADKPNICGSSI